MKLLYLVPVLAALGMFMAADAQTDQESKIKERISLLQGQIDGLQARIDAADPASDAKRIAKWEGKIEKLSNRIVELGAKLPQPVEPEPEQQKPPVVDTQPEQQKPQPVEPEPEQQTQPVTGTEPEQQKPQPDIIPSWIKGLAEYWTDGNISDAEYASVIQLLRDIGIINADSDLDVPSSDTQEFHKVTAEDGQTRTRTTTPIQIQPADPDSTSWTRYSSSNVTGDAHYDFPTHFEPYHSARPGVPIAWANVHAVEINNPPYRFSGDVMVFPLANEESVISIDNYKFIVEDSITINLINSHTGVLKTLWHFDEEPSFPSGITHGNYDQSWEEDVSPLKVYYTPYSDYDAGSYRAYGYDTIQITTANNTKEVGKFPIPRDSGLHTTDGYYWDLRFGTDQMRSQSDRMWHLDP